MPNDRRVENEQALLRLVEDASKGLEDVEAGRVKDANVVLQELRQQRARTTDER